MTKADFLQILRKEISNCIIDDFIVFTVNNWLEDPQKILHNIQTEFDDNIVIIRSSSIQEDRIDLSCAGKYTSVLNLRASDNENIAKGINSVINSYERTTDFLTNQVIIQKQLINTMISGVIFNYDYRNNAPYYIIEYDDTSKKTDTVTAFGLRKKTFIRRTSIGTYFDKYWSVLINTVLEIESIFKDSVIDIEFGFDELYLLHIFQARILKNKPPLISSSQKQLEYSLKKFSGIKNNCSIAFSNMSDWNPAEMLGSNPKPLSSSLYIELISNKTWKTSRAELGYFRPKQDRLIELFCNQPFVNVRQSLASLTPNNISESLREKIICAELNLLKDKPFLHDKIEFEIALSSYFIDEDEFNSRLRLYELSDSEILIYKKEMELLTTNMLSNFADYIAKGYSSLKELNTIISTNKKSINSDSRACGIVNAINLMINSTKLFGVFHFAILARLAFVSEHFIKQLLKKEIISQEEYKIFYSNLNTIPSQINQSIKNVRNGTESSEFFLNNFGHLRLGTYDLLSPQYSEIYKQIFSNPNLGEKLRTKNKINLKLKDDKILLNKYSTNKVLEFAKETIEARENFKFEFTKAISYTLELYKLLSLTLSISLSDFQYLEFSDFKDIQRINENQLTNYLSAKIAINKQKYIESLNILEKTVKLTT